MIHISLIALVSRVSSFRSLYNSGGITPDAGTDRPRRSDIAQWTQSIFIIWIVISNLYAACIACAQRVCVTRQSSHYGEICYLHFWDIGMRWCSRIGEIVWWLERGYLTWLISLAVLQTISDFFRRRLCEVPNSFGIRNYIFVTHRFRHSRWVKSHAIFVELQQA